VGEANTPFNIFKTKKDKNLETLMNFFELDCFFYLFIFFFVFRNSNVFHLTICTVRLCGLSFIPNFNLYKQYIFSLLKNSIQIIHLKDIVIHSDYEP